MGKNVIVVTLIFTVLTAWDFSSTEYSENIPEAALLCAGSLW